MEKNSNYYLKDNVNDEVMEKVKARYIANILNGERYDEEFKNAVKDSSKVKVRKVWRTANDIELVHLDVELWYEYTLNYTSGHYINSKGDIGSRWEQSTHERTDIYNIYQNEWHPIFLKSSDLSPSDGFKAIKENEIPKGASIGLDPNWVVNSSSETIFNVLKKEHSTALGTAKRYRINQWRNFDWNRTLFIWSTCEISVEGYTSLAYGSSVSNLNSYMADNPRSVGVESKKQIHWSNLNLFAAFFAALVGIGCTIAFGIVLVIINDAYGDANGSAFFTCAHLVLVLPWIWLVFTIAKYAYKEKDTPKNNKRCAIINFSLAIILLVFELVYYYS